MIFATAINFRGKVGKIDLLISIHRWHSETNWSIAIRFNGNDLSTICVNLMRLGPVTPEFTRVFGVHPLVDQQWNYVRWAARSVLSFVLLLFAKGRHC